MHQSMPLSPRKIELIDNYNKNIELFLVNIIADIIKQDNGTLDIIIDYDAQDIDYEPGDNQNSIMSKDDLRIAFGQNQIDRIDTKLKSEVMKRLKTSFINYKNLDSLLKMANIEYEIYVDMDGVIVDFDKAFIELGYGSPQDYQEEHGEQAFWNLIKNKTNHFWRNMDWTPDGQELWNYIKKYNPKILTTPAPAYVDPHCPEDKKMWVKKNLGNAEVILSRKKSKYASPNSILIDDMDKNIIPWEEAGGIAIKHISANNTIMELKELLEGKTRPKKVYE